jgi:hypothetical protein
LLLPERTSQALVQGLDYLLSHYPDRAATRRHAEQFSWSATTAGQMRLFERVLSDNAESNFDARRLRTPAI